LSYASENLFFKGHLGKRDDFILTCKSFLSSDFLKLFFQVSFWEAVAFGFCLTP